MATPPLIEAGDITEDGDNSITTPWNINTPAYADGDMLIMHLGGDGSSSGSGAVQHGALPNGPNAESPVTIVHNFFPDSDTYGPTISVWYYICSGSSGTSSVQVTPSTGDQWVSMAVLIPSGEFNGTTPLDPHASSTATHFDNSNSGDLIKAANNADNADGTICFYGAVDTDSIGSAPTNYTNIASTDIGFVSNVFATRDTASTASESIAATGNWNAGINDSTASVTYIVQAPAAGGAANPKGPLGMPLHGTFGGPI